MGVKGINIYTYICNKQNRKQSKKQLNGPVKKNVQYIVPDRHKFPTIKVLVPKALYQKKKKKTLEKQQIWSFT